MENSLKSCINRICRICMCETQYLKSLFSKLIGEERTLADITTSITNINISAEDCLPKQVCNNCEVILCKTDAFIQRALKVDKILNNVSDDSRRHVNYIDLMRESLVKHEMKVEEDQATPYQCSICFIRFCEVSKLEKHVTNSHSTNKDLFCEVDFAPTSNNVLMADKSLEIIKEEPVSFDFDNSFDNEDYCTFREENTSTTENISICSCGSVFDRKDTYKTHLKTDCLESKILNRFQKKSDISLKCQKCQLKFDTILELKKHKLLHKNKSIRNGQNAEIEQKKSNYQCSLCMRKFVKKSSLTLHIKKHEEDANVKHTCNICKREFQHEAHLKNHILLLHTKEKGYTCDFCMKTFATHNDLESHKQTHTNEKKHRCHLCEKSFYMLSTLKDHMRTHTGEKPFLCSECGKGFSQKNNLTQHMRRHQGLKPFKCENCEKRFVSKGELVAHTRKHSGAHPFICPDCGNGFTTSSSLVKHRRTHSGERPYACDLCNMRFAASGTLTNHRRTHTGEKPYVCSYCNKSFVQRNDLISHIRCHTGERPYVCSTCGQAFRKGSALKTHLKLHLKEPLQLQRDNLMLQSVNVLLSGVENPN